MSRSRHCCGTAHTGRWDPAARARFFKLLETLGREFDGCIEAIVFPETAIGVGIPSLRKKRLRLDFIFWGDRGAVLLDRRSPLLASTLA
jgi:hypothetical protein